MAYTTLHINVWKKYLPCFRVRKSCESSSTKLKKSFTKLFKLLCCRRNILKFFYTLEACFEGLFWGLFTDPNSNSVLPSSMLSLNEPEWLIARGLSSKDVALPHSWESSYRSKEVSCAGMLFERIILGPGRLNWDRLVGLTGIQSFINEAHFLLMNFGSA